jgi:hypothetical protein
MRSACLCNLAGGDAAAAAAAAGTASDSCVVAQQFACSVRGLVVCIQAVPLPLLGGVAGCLWLLLLPVYVGSSSSWLVSHVCLG